jgi:hypothetical protein
MEQLPKEMLMEIERHLDGELAFVNRKSYDAYLQMVKLKIGNLDKNTRSLLLGTNDLEKYNHYINIRTYTQHTSKYRTGLSLLLMISRGNADVEWSFFRDNLTLAEDGSDRLNPDLRKYLDLDDIYRYIGYHYYGKNVRDLIYLSKRGEILLGPDNTNDDDFEYISYLLSLMFFSRARRDYDSYRQKVDRGEIEPVDLNDIRSLFDLYRYASDSSVVQLMEDVGISKDDIPLLIGSAWEYMYCGYYGDVTQAKTLVKGKHAQLLLDYALIGGQSEIVRLCVREGVNVSRYFDLRPSLVLELKPPNWEFYAIETGDIEVIAKTLESPNFLTINDAFGHHDVIEAMNRNKQEAIIKSLTEDNLQ